VKGLWLGVIGFRDAQRSEPLEKLAADFSWFEDHAPWADEYKRRGYRPPAAEALLVAASAGAARPLSTSSLRVGEKALLFPEIDDAVATARHLRITAELASPELAEEMLRCRSQVHFATVALREVIGRAAGIPPPASAAAALAENGAALEVARAELVAHWHAQSPRLRELGLIDDERCQAIWPELAAVGWLTSLVRVTGERLESPELRAAQLMLWWFMQRHALAARKVAGKTYLVAPDRALFHRAAGSLLLLLETIRHTGDAALLRGLVEAHAARLDPRLRDELAARLAALSIPRRVAVLAPVLRPVLENTGIVDAAAAPVEDLDAQLLEDWDALLGRSDQN
jgi:dipeptidyl-peptidase-3